MLPQCSLPTWTALRNQLRVITVLKSRVRLMDRDPAANESSGRVGTTYATEALPEAGLESAFTPRTAVILVCISVLITVTIKLVRRGRQSQLRRNAFATNMTYSRRSFPLQASRPIV